MVSNQQFRLKWNNHRNTVLQEFETLLHNNSFVDCTIGADGKYLKAHKIVLSACSPYLQNVFSEHFDKHPVILLKDVSFKELKCMIDYMYCGEVNISECELPSFLRTAQSLKIKGLAEDINEYDDSGASDNEHQEISSLTENGRTVEPNVEIHDDEGPPIKRSAPSLIYSNFAGRKRKSPNAISSGAPKTSNNGDKSIAAPTSKTGGNVPSCADTDNSDSNVCTTSKDSSVNKDDNDKKSNSQDDLQEHKNKAVVKEEPLDADDDNSSYEFVNNPCDDSDPLNEDSESNCANSGKNFNEVSIANVSSCNESEANDGDDTCNDDDDGQATKIKEELLISEVVTLSDDYTDEGKIRVRSSEELMSSPGTVQSTAETAIYIVGGPAMENDDEEIIGESDLAIASGSKIDDDIDTSNCSVEIDSLQSIAQAKQQPRSDAGSTEKNPSNVVTRFLSSGKGYKKMKFYDRARKCKAPIIRSKESTAESNKERKPQQPASFRKILPAPLKAIPVLRGGPNVIPVTMTCPSNPSSTKPAAMLTSADGKISVPLQNTYKILDPSTSPSLLTPLPPDDKRKLRSSSAKEKNSQPILLSKVMLLNSSEMQSTSAQPVYSLSELTSKVTETTEGREIRQVAYIQAASTSAASGSPVKDVTYKATIESPAIASVAAKFRKIAPLPEGVAHNVQICTPCRVCLRLFTDRNELRKHMMTVCTKSIISKKGRKKNDT